MLRFSLILALSCGVAGCTPEQMAALNVPSSSDSDWKGLGVGYVGTPGVSITGDGIDYESGQAFTPSFAIDCRKLGVQAVDYIPAIKAGAKLVNIRINGERKKYYGVLALCKVHSSAVGPGSRSYTLQIPPDRLAQARGGLISTVGEVVDTDRPANGSGQVNFASLLGLPATGGNAPSAGPQHFEDLSWILWITDRGPTFTEVPKA